MCQSCNITVKNKIRVTLHNDLIVVKAVLCHFVCHIFVGVDWATICVPIGTRLKLLR